MNQYIQRENIIYTCLFTYTSPHTRCLGRQPCICLIASYIPASRLLNDLLITNTVELSSRLHTLFHGMLLIPTNAGSLFPP